MTRRANEWTSSATASAGPPPLHRRASELRVFVEALESLGFDAASLLKRAGLRRSRLDDPDAFVSCEAVEVVLKGAFEERRFPNLPAHLAFHTPMGAFPLLDYLVLTTDTVGDALRQLQRYFHLTSAPCRLDIVEDKNAVRLLVQPGTEPFAAEYTTAIAVHHLRDETAQRLRVSYVSLMREPDDRLDLERLLGCPVRAPATWTGIDFPRDAMTTPLRRRDPVLRSVLEGRVTSPVPHAESGSAASRVRVLLISRIGDDLPDIGELARQLGLAPRTLQRRLAAEGMSYKELVDLIRRESAERLLADRSLAVAEVGYLLGFSEPSAFHRAFKRWLRLTPLEYRRNIASPAEPTPAVD
jgi:AraC-like DNA-binding protein